MRSYLFAAPLLAAALILSACVLPGGLSGAKAGKPAANPITGSTVTTESLDDTGPGEPVAGQVDASYDAIMASEAQTTAPAKAAPAVAAAAAPAAAPAAVPVEPAAPATPEALKCVKQGGTWATAGDSGAKACVKRTKDGGKACTKETQCEGYCLARSHSCAPIKPMFGCTDILQADGREVTLCLD